MFNKFIRNILTPFLSRHLLFVETLGLKKVWVVDYESLTSENEDYSLAVENLRKFLISGYNLKGLSSEYIEQNSDISILYKRKPNPSIIRVRILKLKFN